MKKIICLLISFTVCSSLVLTACIPINNIPSSTHQSSDLSSNLVTQTPTIIEDIFRDFPPQKIRVVVDGKVNSISAILKDGDWYLTPDNIKTALGIEAKTAKGGYANLRTVAKEADFSYEHDNALNAAYIWTNQKYYDGDSYDFNRAIELNLVPEDLKRDIDRQINAIEFRALLSDLVNRLNPEKTEWFNENVSFYDKPLLRGEGFVMAYFAAVCVGVNTMNNDFEHTKADGGDFWNTDIYQADALFPHVWEGPVNFLSGQEWNNSFTAAFLWSFWYSSTNSGNQVFEYDEATGSMRQNQPLTVREAVEAVVRINDGVKTVNYVSLNDDLAINFDRSIITDKHLLIANDLPDIPKDHMPVWRGFVLSGGGNYENRDIIENEKDLRNIANWGFNSARLMVTYQTFFDAKAEQVDIGKLQKLDTMIAAAIKYHLHINLLTFSLPGRWTNFDDQSFITTGELDLFTNPTRQKEVDAIWAMLAERYKEIPSSVLSFTPIWEAQNPSLSSGLHVPPYTDKEVALVYMQVINTIKEHDSDRFIIFEPTANNSAQDIVTHSEFIKRDIQNKYPDALMMVNFCEQPYVYSDMTAASGANIDRQSYSMFKPVYPTVNYAAQFHLEKDIPFEINGALKAGTKIDIYLSKVSGNGKLTVMAGDHTLYSEDLSTMNYKTEAPLSGFYPYAKSDKLVSITLSSDIDNLQVSYSGSWFEWSGVDVTLPTNNAVKRWWFPSAYDRFLDDTISLDPILKETSTIMISPNSYDKGNPITINEDITFSSSEIFAQSNKQTIEDWAKILSAYSPSIVVRFESGGRTAHDSVLRYYNDVLSTFEKYGMSWYNANDYYSITHANYAQYAGIEYVLYNDQNLDIKMIELLQKYQ